MHKELHWKKGAFSNTYKISYHKEFIGSLSTEVFRSNATGQIEEDKYVFKSQGLLSRTIHVFEYISKQKIASIKVSAWGRKAQIKTKDKQYLWNFKNFWQTKWTIADQSKTYISGTHSSLLSKGNLIYRDADNFLILVSIYIIDYLKRRNSAG